jgi:hypothetical protein
MTKKDFELIARALRDARPGGNVARAEPNVMMQWTATVMRISAALMDTNPRFDAERFRKACGTF